MRLELWTGLGSVTSTPHPPEEALEAETYVERVRGQWDVSIVVISADEVVRTHIATYRTERMANVADSWIKRAARRDVATPMKTESRPGRGGRTDLRTSSCCPH